MVGWLGWVLRVDTAQKDLQKDLRKVGFRMMDGGDDDGFLGYEWDGYRRKSVAFPVRLFNVNPARLGFKNKKDS